MALSDFNVVLEKMPLIPREKSKVSFQRVFFVSLYSVIVACSWGVVVSLCAQAAGFGAWKHGSGLVCEGCGYRCWACQVVDPVKHHAFLEAIRDGWRPYECFANVIQALSGAWLQTYCPGWLLDFSMHIVSARMIRDG
jgi:hypothetical protein